MKLIRGAPGSGKTALVFREFKAARERGETDIRLVVPTSTLVRHFQHELARDGLVFPPHCVLSLNRFVRDRAGGDQAPRVAPETLLRALVRSSLPQGSGEGVVSAYLETIGLFETAGSMPEGLARVRRLSVQAKSFEKVWRAVGDALHQRDYVTRAELIRLAASNQAASNQERMRIWFDGFSHFRPPEGDLLRSLAACCDVTLTLTDSPETDEARRLAIRLGAEDHPLPGAVRKAQAVHLEARTPEREADEIARRILGRHRQGARFREIAVVVRDTATYLSLLRRTFERFGIPARFYFSNSLSTHPVARFLGGLIAASLNGWDFEATIDALREHPRWGHSADFDRFDFAVREVMPGHGAESLAELCESDWLRAEIAALLKRDDWRNTSRPASSWFRLLSEWATALYRPGRLDPARDHVAVASVRSHSAALRAWLAAIESVTTFWIPPEDPIKLEEFWRIASDAIDSSLFHLTDDREDAIAVMSTREARQWDVDALFVCGLTDREFPRQPPRNLLFSEGDIERLRASGIPLRSAADFAREERWLFESLKTRAGGSLFLSCPRHDAAGKSLQCSRWLVEMNGTPEPARIAVPELHIPAETHAISGKVHASALQSEMARLHRSISITSLEDLAQCRFKFFARRTLALGTAPEEAADRLNARITGSILHKALERWLADRTADFVAIFESTFDEMCRAEHLKPGYQLEVERIQCRDIARRVSANDLWNADASSAEVELALEFPGGITVNGRVDRIDRFGADCVIVDYKSSRTARVQKLVTSQTALQGPLYALAARERLNLNPVAMLFWAVREDRQFGWGHIPGTSLAYQPIPENWADEARTRTAERLSGFLAGDVHVHPEEADSCRWCDFRAACRVEQQASLILIQGAQSA